MFFYGMEGTINIVASLSELETGVLLLGQPGAPFNADHARWSDYAAAVLRAMQTGGKIHVTVEESDGKGIGRWRGPLAEAPAECRAAVDAALGFFAARGGATYDGATVEVIGLGGQDRAGE